MSFTKANLESLLMIAFTMILLLKVKDRSNNNFKSNDFIHFFINESFLKILVLKKKRIQIFTSKKY